MPVVIKAAINTAVQTFAGKATDANAAQNALDIVDYVNACVNNNVNVTGGGFEGLCIRGGQVFFHSPDGKPTGVPTASQIRAALDDAAVARLLAALTQKFS